MAEAPATAARTMEGADGAEPELSVILVTDGLELIAEMLDHLRAQTVLDRLELVVVAMPGAVPADSHALAPFRWVQVVESDTRQSPPMGRAAGVRAARAPVVVFGETHCFPEPAWAEMLLEAHKGPWTAVSPEIRNANPERRISWANLLVDYSPWVGPETSRPMDDLPGHNSSYKRATLMEFGDDLDRMFESESIMHWDLRERGHRMYLESRAIVRHRNITQVGPSLVEHFNNGRCFGGLRSRSWSAGRRALYAAASPLIPLVRLRRLVAEARRKGLGHVLPGALPVIVLDLAFHAAGEMTGYVAGSGEAVRDMASYELDRDIYAEA